MNDNIEVLENEFKLVENEETFISYQPVPVQPFVATLTTDNYRYGLSIFDDGKGQKAHIVLTKKIIQLQEINGIFYFDGVPETEIDWSELIDSEQTLDRQPLRALFTCIDRLLEEGLAKGLVPYEFDGSCEVNLSIKKLAKMLGWDPSVASSRQFQYLYRTILGYENILGILPGKNGKNKRGQRRFRFSRVMFLTEFDLSNDRMRFSSPYFCKLKMASYRESLIATETKGRLLINTNENGLPLRKPSETLLIKSTMKESYAAEAIEYIIPYLERSSNLKKGNVPALLADTIVEHCPNLKRQLDRSTAQNKNVTLDRFWMKLWIDISNDSYVMNAFPDIEFPDPQDKASRPSYTKLKKVKFSFPHKKKKKNWIYEVDKEGNQYIVPPTKPAKQILEEAEEAKKKKKNEDENEDKEKGTD